MRDVQRMIAIIIIIFSRAHNSKNTPKKLHRKNLRKRTPVKQKSKIEIKDKKVHEHQDTVKNNAT